MIIIVMNWMSHEYVCACSITYSTGSGGAFALCENLSHQLYISRAFSILENYVLFGIVASLPEEPPLAGRPPTQAVVPRPGTFQ